MVYMYHSFLIHSSADGHLGCFYVLAIIKSAAMNIGEHVSLSDLVSSVCMPRVGCFERTASKHVYYLGWNRSPAQVGCMRQLLGPGALGRPRGIGWRGRWEGASGWGIHVNPWLIHVSVWQNPLQYCKVISLQLIKINEKQKCWYPETIQICASHSRGKWRYIELEYRRVVIYQLLLEAYRWINGFLPMKTTSLQDFSGGWQSSSQYKPPLLWQRNCLIKVVTIFTFISWKGIAVRWNAVPPKQKLEPSLPFINCKWHMAFVLWRLWRNSN